MSQEGLTIEKRIIDCPHCKGKVDVTIEKTMPKVILRDNETKVVDNTVENVTTHITEQSPELKVDHHKMIAESMPKGINFGRCAGENCGKKIKNAKGLTTKFKTCSNCDRNAVAANKKDCPFCGSKFDPEDEPDIDDIADKIEDSDESTEE